MEVKPKKFICKVCRNETYADGTECKKCGAKDTIKPIPKDYYKCYLNGVFYGTGSLNYMRELFVDYVVINEMYGKSAVDFRIVKMFD